MAKPKHYQEGDGSEQDTASAGRAAIHGDHEDYGDRVAQRAYELYLSRGAADGRDFDDWLTAERELAQGRNGDRSE